MIREGVNVKMVDGGFRTLDGRFRMADSGAGEVTFVTGQSGEAGAIWGT